MSTSDKMPSGISNAYWFQVFNTMSFAVVLQSPMQLLFKELGATATILGIVSALPPLLVILQIPAAKYLETVGYKKFTIGGWTLRSFFIIGMAAVAFLPSGFDRTTRIALLLFLLFLYNTSRGISSCGWLPWITLLIPEGVRGRYLSNDQTAGGLAQVATLFFVGWLVSGHGGMTMFGLALVLSFFSAMVSLYFINRIPDVTVPAGSKNSEPVPWAEMFRYAPFQKLLLYNIVYQSAMAAGGVFWIPFLRDNFGLTSSNLLVMAACTNTCIVITLLGFGALADRVGSRPLLVLAAFGHMIHFAGWGLVAARVLPCSLPVMAWQTVTAGFSGALFNLARWRLTMSLVPEMGRSHFFAMFSVAENLTLGFLPILWGVILDAILRLHVKWHFWEWNAYSVLYLVLSFTVFGGWLLLRRVPETRAMSTEDFLHEMLVKMPTRGLSRWLGRRPPAL
jgi:MFS family permease